MHHLFNEHGIWRVFDDVLLLNVNELEKAVNYLSQKNPAAAHIGISAENDFKTAFLVDFDLIYRHLPHIQSFWVRCSLHKDTDISPLYRFENLEKLTWGENAIALELGKFPQLKKFYFDGTKQHQIDFRNKQIRTLGVDGVADLSFLKDFPSVEKLILRAYRGTDLKGIGHLTRLNDLDILGAKKITDIQHLAECLDLEFFWFECFDKNLDLSPLSATNICGLYLHNAIKTCDFVWGMKGLKNITIKEVLDDDLLPLIHSETLEHVYLYKHKKSYNCSKKAFEERFPNG